MIRQYELVDLVKAYNPEADEALLNRAYVFGAKAHAHQQRANGEPYFGHPLEVAKILTALKLDDATIVTALLHDTVEDTEATRDQVEKLFVQGCARASGEAGGPSAQHAHDQLPSPGQANPDRA